MHLQSQLCAEEKPFAASQAYCNALFEQLNAGATQGMDHVQMEQHLCVEGREILRLMMQDAVNQASKHDRQLDVVGADGLARTHQRRGRRLLNIVVGTVSVTRETYAARKTAMLAPVDAALNLPAQSYSFGVRRHIAEQAALVSYDTSIETVGNLAGIEIPKRQAEEQRAAAAVDFEDF